MKEIKDSFKDKPSSITLESVYYKRREIIKSAGLFGAGISSLALPSIITSSFAQGLNSPTALKSVPSSYTTVEKQTSESDATSYNNYYEFGTDKADPAKAAKTLKLRPWTIKVSGLVSKPKTFDIEELLKLSAIEERIYRLRCVEGWSMVIPWLGYSLSNLIKQVQPLGSAKFVEFVTLADPKQMPGLNSRVLDWPYSEGLRLDEALHPLTLLSFGMYGKTLPQQNGAPVRLIVPWKYGFKSAKTIVEIKFSESLPGTSWNKSAKNEYGFYSNVNPDVDHPRWSQATERRIGEDGLFAKKRKTLMFNGYGEQVGQLYAGMDLKKNF